ncbi:MAG: NUDIX domain-containing protein [Christensenellaceae bacterium]|jgi:8-oxo-dGTP pyrophosphatase MutT (NUDIX family)|nr:NUDIX domain-containing protein [Christensenellaceae bacterium]
MKEELLERLFFHHPTDFDEQEDLIKVINFVKENDISSNPDIHVTASAFVFNADKTKVLLVKHKKTGLWQQLGGHIEKSDVLLIDAALREAREESGKEDIEVFNDGKIFNVVIYTMKKDVVHTHLDIWFVFTVKTEEFNPFEGQQLKWFDQKEFGELNKKQKDKGLMRAVKKWKYLLKKGSII